jgi:hypothetical protein
VPNIFGAYTKKQSTHAKKINVISYGTVPILSNLTVQKKWHCWSAALPRGKKKVKQRVVEAGPCEN